MQADTPTDQDQDHDAATGPRTRSTTDSADQRLLSRFGAGDVDDLDLSIDDSNGRDTEGRRRAKEYAQKVTPGEWEVISVSADQIWFGSSDYRNLYKLINRGGTWCGRNGNYSVRPHESDLQDALNGAAEYMAENPIE